MSAPAPSASLLQAPPAGRYRIDPARTAVRFTARHMFGLGRVTGTFSVREAELIVGNPATATSLNAVLDATSFETGSAKRDADVRSAKYLDADTYPDINFTCPGVRQCDGKWIATGTITAAGISAPAEVTLESFDDEMAGEVTLRASARVDRYAHKVTAGKGLVGRWLTFDITAVAAAG
jgi:polyisoprenoid-binding protein YceI